jgi:hypothetical protein
MKKIFFCFLFMNFAAFNLVKAQSLQPAFSLGTDVGFPFKNYKANVGFDAKAELPLLPGLKFIFSAGYSALIPDNKVYIVEPATGNVCDGCVINNTALEPSYHFIPVKAGLRYYYETHFYVDGDAGAAFKANDVANTSFIYGFGLGVLLPFNPHNSLDFGLSFESGYKTIDYDNSESQVGVNLAYRYQF